MAKTEKEYVQLPGRGYRRDGLTAVAWRGSLCTLWMGKDHLLSVDLTGYTEEYKRFYYRDIQALVFRKTVNGAILNLVLLVFTAIFVAAAVAVDDSVGTGALGFFAGMFGVGLVINAAFGPTCKSYLQTAVQTQELPSLRRLRGARKALAKLQPVIEAAQGRLTMEDATVTYMANPADAAIGAGVTSAAVSSPAPELVHYHGRFHLVLFITLLIDALMAIIGLSIHETFLAFNGFITLVELVCLIGALLRQHRSDVPRIVQKLTWGFLWAFTAIFIVGLIIGFVMAVSGEKADVNNPMRIVMSLFSIAICLGVGVPGLRALIAFRRGQTPPPMPPMPPMPPPMPPVAPPPDS